MPEVRRFLKEGHTDQYDDLIVKYIPGRNPELFIFDKDNKEVSLYFILPYRFSISLKRTKLEECFSFLVIDMEQEHLRSPENRGFNFMSSSQPVLVDEQVQSWEGIWRLSYMALKADFLLENSLLTSRIVRTLR